MTNNSFIILLGCVDMREKNQFIELMNVELDRLISTYEMTIKNQKEEIEQLVLLLQKSENEKEALLKSLEVTVLKEEAFIEESSSDSVNDNKSFNPTYKDIENIISSNSKEEMQRLLSAAKKMWRRMDIEKLTQVFEKLNEQPRLLKFDNDDINKEVLSLFKSILLKEDLTELEHDQLVNEIINLGLNLVDTPLATKITEFLKRKNDKLFENVVLRNEPFMIIQYLRMLLEFKCEEEVKGALQHLLNIEWSFIDASLKKEEFEFFLWYAYLFDLDQELIDKSNVSLQWFNKNSKELTFYLYFSNEKYIQEEKYKFKVSQFMSGKVLKSHEKMLVLEKVEKEIREKVKTIKEIPIYKNPIIIISSRDFYSYNKQYKLEKQYISLPLYQKHNMHQIYFYIETDKIFISQKDGTAFLYEEDYKKLLKENSPLVFKISQVNKKNINQNSIYQREENSFAWPSTDVKPNEIKRKNNEDKTMNETSELKKMGYQITGITRDQRWKSLESAVPKIGLKKVVQIISYNIKLRKGQKNGEKKFSYAISEWEHDLAKLKKHYYKQEFKWPEL